MDDRIVPAVISITALDPIAENGGNQPAFLISLTDAGSSGSYTVDYSTVNGSATSGNDYSAITGSVTLTGSNPTATIYASALDNGYDEANKTFYLNLANATGTEWGDGYSGSSGSSGSGYWYPFDAAPNIGTSTAEATILDDESSNNSPPNANDDGIYSASATSSASGNVLANDTDTDVLSAWVMNGPSKGSLTLESNGDFIYTPYAGSHGSDSFTYAADDGHSGSGTATAYLDIQNTAPTAVDQSASTTRGVAVTGNVLTGVTDADGDPLTANAATYITVNGNAVTINSDGTYTFTPAGSFTGSDSFTFQANDNYGGAASGSVSVEVSATPPNHAPTAQDQSLSTPHGVTVFGNLLSGAYDEDGDPLTVSIAMGPYHGAITLDEITGAFSYTSTGTFVGVENIPFYVSDGLGGTATGTVTVEVTNAAPVTRSFFLTTPTSTTLTANVLDGASDEDGDSLTVIAVDTVTTSKGNVYSINSDGTFTFTPSITFVGSDTIPFTVIDGYGGETTGTMTVAVAGPGSVVGNVWYDSNEDQHQNSGEDGLAGVEVELIPEGEQDAVETTTTDENGNYQISTEIDGSYYLRFTEQNRVPFEERGGDNAANVNGITLPFMLLQAVPAVKVKQAAVKPVAVPKLDIVRNDKLPGPPPINPEDIDNYLDQSLSDNAPGYVLKFNYKSDTVPDSARRNFITASKVRTILVYTDGTANYVTGSDNRTGYMYFSNVVVPIAGQTTLGAYAALGNVAPPEGKQLLFVYHDDETKSGLSTIAFGRNPLQGKANDTSENGANLSNAIVNPNTASFAYVYYNPTGVQGPKQVVDTALKALTPKQDLDNILNILKGTQAGVILGDKKFEAIFHPQFTSDSSKPTVGK